MNELAKILVEMAPADTPNMDSAASVAEFVFGSRPVIIKRVGLVVTTALDTDNSVACTATMTRRPVAGSSSNAVSLGTFAIAAANSAVAAGKVVVKDLAITDHDGETAEDGSLRHEAPNSNITPPVTGHPGFLILPGQSFAITLDTNAECDSGAARAFVEYLPLGLSDVYDENVIYDTSDL